MLDKVADVIRQFIFRRQHAYRRVFDGPLGEEVLEDLAHFCRAAQTTFHTDPHIHSLQDGRREVWLRIQDHLNLSPEELYKISTGIQSRYPTVVKSAADED